MGKYLKRVSLDFDYPLNKMWYGYLNPYRGHNCPVCGGTGYPAEYQKLQDEWYSFDKSEWVYLPNGRRYNKLAWHENLTQEDVDALWEAKRLYDFKEKPTPEQVNEWNRVGFGHDSINCWICIKAKLERLGLPEDCSFCHGEGVLYQPGIQELAEKWEQLEPPAGDGFQLWQDTSEDSPISPVFDTLEALCEWCEGNAHTFAYDTATKEEWLQMLSNNFVHVTEQIGNMTATFI